MDYPSPLGLLGSQKCFTPHISSQISNLLASSCQGAYQGRNRSCYRSGWPWSQCQFILLYPQFQSTWLRRVGQSAFHRLKNLGGLHTWAWWSPTYVWWSLASTGCTGSSMTLNLSISSCTQLIISTTSRTHFRPSQVFSNFLFVPPDYWPSLWLTIDIILDSGRNRIVLIL